MGKPQSPGPVYKLPPTIGYNKHDVSRYRNPQYSISPKVYPPGNRGQVPGPQYDTRGLTEHGKPGDPKYSIKSRPKDLTPFNPPGPGAYKVEKVPRMKEPRPPAYSMQRRLGGEYKSIGPGPVYLLPSMLGPKVANKNAAAAYTMSVRYKDLGKADSPGPATYKNINSNIYKHKLPQYSMAGRLAMRDREKSPGPAKYILKKLCGEKGPMFTMGHVAPDSHSPYITPEDNMPCADR